MAIQKTEALVLKTIPFRSSSLIVTLFSKSFGKIKGIVKGVRKEREMRGAAFELFTLVEVIFYEKTRSDLHLISDAAMIESNDALRTRLETISYGSYFCELVDTLTEVHDPHPELFETLTTCLRFLKSLPPQRVARIFEVKLLDEVGWLPHFDSCLGCRKEDVREGFFSIAQGALLCPQCAPRVQDAHPISPESLDAIRFFIARDPESSMKYHLPKSAESGLGKLTDTFLRYRLAYPLKSKRFLTSLKPVLG